MLEVRVVEVFGAEAVHLFGGQFAVVGGDCEHLMAGGFDGSRLVDVDVAGCGCYDAFVRAESGGDDCGVGLRAADEEMHVDVGILADLADEGACLGADSVVAVAGVLQVGRCRESAEDLRASGAGIVASEVYHCYFYF